MIKKAGLISILIAISITFAGCHKRSTPGPGADLAPAPARSEAVSNPEINAYLASLRYDPREILAEQVGDSVFPAKALPDDVNDDGSASIICKQVKHRLSGNLDDSLILSPIHAVAWPG